METRRESIAHQVVKVFRIFRNIDIFREVRDVVSWSTNVVDRGTSFFIERVFGHVDDSRQADSQRLPHVVAEGLQMGRSFQV